MQKEKPQKSDPKSIKDEKRYVLERRDGCCMVGLGRPGKYGRCMGVLDPHHIINKGAGGKDHRTNLISLCRRHHNDAQSHRIPRRELFQILNEYYGYPIPEVTKAV